MENKELNKEAIKRKILGLCLKGEIVDEQKGTKGIVYKVDLGQNAFPRYIAYKTLETLEEKIEEAKLKEFIHEAKIWFKAKSHPLIVTPLYITYFENIPLICMPFCDKDLKSYLCEKGKFDPIEALVYTAQILKALIFCESKGLEAHQDLKPGNVLLENLSKKFRGYPPPGVHECLKFKIRLADFGLANAWRELGKPQGSFPYMAPEQYTPQQYKTFNPDIFATGVMMTEMLTGRHPSGKRTKRFWNDWSRRKKMEWAKEGERKIPIGTDEISRKLEDVIQNMLLPNPEERPSKKEILSKIMGILFKLDESTAINLKLLFEYYDIWPEYHADEDRLHAAVQISQFPGQLDIVINELQEEIALLKKSVDTPSKAIYFCQLCGVISDLLLRRRTKSDAEKVKDFAEQIIREAIKWKVKIKTHHRYPELKLKEMTLIETPPLRDFEVFAETIGIGRRLLINVIGREETEKIFKDKDDYTKSAYFFGMASDFRYQEEETKAIETLDKCIKLNPEEPLFYHFKAVWTHGYLHVADMFKKLE